ncbi:protein of unknown function [Thiothrix eikelboomii]|uniref:DUF4166 domain-containing protein n=1 Tax=Thiothrix eikelboomii TaxID=92487 RepID=A0A1T4XXI7_9GAMM|nr:DUF4166 domain-containing protein [Thiothrix eikelboomii]SKA94246.1 protein of unknown function [Thiothrix eikelboomii]
MTEVSIMQRALGAQWETLAPALKAHYAAAKNRDLGILTVEYPTAMQGPLNVLRLFGTLINQRAQKVPTQVYKWMVGEQQYWQRRVELPKQVMAFDSHWHYVGGNELIEYVKPYLGLKMAVTVRDGKLYYEGRAYILKLGSLLIPIPEALVLGHTTIEEIGVDAKQFTMDFRLQHPLFGQIYRYTGRFHTELEASRPQTQL